MSELCRSMASHGAALIALVPKGMALMGIVFAGGEADWPRFVNLNEARQCCRDNST